MRDNRFSMIRWLALCAGLPVFAVAVLLPAAAAAADPAKPDEVYAALGADDVPADYVILVDTSASMLQGNRYEELKENLKRFYAALAPKDLVTLVPFDLDARPRDTIAAGRSPDELVAQLPPTATGQKTDIGKAIEASLAVLRRDGAPPIATVLLLTDGQHLPGPNSPYPFTDGFGWNALKQQASAIKKTSLSAFAIPLSAATGAGLLQKVFPSVEVLDAATIGTIIVRLEVPKQQIRQSKARSQLGDDNTHGVQVVWPGSLGELEAGDNEVLVTLRSTATRIPLQVTELSVKTDDPQLTVKVPGRPVDLQPGQSVTVPVSINWNAGPSSWKFRDRVPLAGRMSLTGKVGSPWSDVLTKDLGLPFAPALDVQEAAIGGVAERGRPGFWYGSTVFAIALLFAGWLMLWLRTHPRLTGVLSVSKQDAVLGVIPLGRRRVQLPGQVDLIGSGSVRGRRVSVGSGAPIVVAEVSYSPDGTAKRRQQKKCPANQSLLINGARFSWLPEGAEGAVWTRPKPAPTPEPPPKIKAKADPPLVTPELLPAATVDPADYVDTFDYPPGESRSAKH